MEEQINQTPPSEEATTIGMFLKYTRLKQKKSIEAVSDALCIRRVYIKALEEDDYQTLPPIPYGVGFVRSYASYLGLNASRIVQVYKQQAFPQKEKPVQVVVPKQATLTIPHKKYVYLSLLAVLLLYIIWVSVHLISTHKQTPDTDSALSQVEVIEVMPIDEEPDVDNPIIEPVQDEKPEPVAQEDTSSQVVIIEGSYEEKEEKEPVKQQDSIRLKLKGESWIELKDNEKVYVSGIRQKGFEYSAPYVPGMILSVGKYYNVDVYLNGVLTQVAGPRKQTNINLDKFIKH